MKNKTLAYLFFAILAASALMAFAPKGEGEFAPKDYYTYGPAQDTITDTEADTLQIPVNLLSSWTYGFSVVLGNLSGTTNVAVVLQQSHVASGTTDWKTLATFTGTSGILHLDGTDVTGVRHRLILTGSGTQSSTYNIDAIYKKKY